MKLSIIIPVYNVEKYLETCIKSVLPLKSELEILLVDDGSTDQSGKICDSLAEKDDRIRVIHKENGGLSDARNVGIENSTGDYLMFLDSDDFLNAEETERLITQITSKTDIAVGLYREFYEEKNLYKDEECVPFLENTGTMLTDDFFKIIPKNGQSCYLVAVRFVVNREYILNNSLFFFEGIYHEDEEWVPRLLINSKNITVTDCFFYNYRQAREGSITANIKPKHVWDSLTILKHHSNLFFKCPPDSAKANFILCRMAMIYSGILLNFRVLNAKEKEIALKEIKDVTGLCTQQLCGLKGKLIKLSLKILGIKPTFVVFGFFQKLFKF